MLMTEASNLRFKACYVALFLDSLPAACGLHMRDTQQYFGCNLQSED